MSEVVESKGPQVPSGSAPPSSPARGTPVEAPRPAATPQSATGIAPRLVVTGRRARVLTFPSDRWAPRKAAGRAALAVAPWGYPGLDEHDFLKAVHGLVEAAVAAGGKRVSVHLADQDAKILVMALSHRTDGDGGTGDGGRVPTEVALLRTVEACGTHTDHDGHAWWALLNAEPRPRRTQAQDLSSKSRRRPAGQTGV
ncbi:hypothetical protein AB0469_03155 [Streptomyces sp. NPDC093801]|uniref:hypothetical protein n=1 Tax=Streptomyces sp. NPDC093801 TaxID=3155203 RepID=UPI00344C139C